MNTRKLFFYATTLIFVTISGHSIAVANESMILQGYADQANLDDAGFKGFSAERGKAFFLSIHTTGKPDTPSCTSCHTNSANGVGVTRAGKKIEPMALSRSPDRYTDPKKVEKWFRRNCNSVLGRACTSLEKGDFIAFMINQ